MAKEYQKAQVIIIRDLGTLRGLTFGKVIYFYNQEIIQ